MIALTAAIQVQVAMFKPRLLILASVLGGKNLINEFGCIVIALVF